MSKKKIKEKSKKEISKKPNKDEESELEKEIEEIEEEKVLEKNSEEIIEDNEFHSFMKPSIESFSPVLEPTETFSQESLEQNVGSAPLIQGKKDEKSKDYETGYKDASEEYKRNENLIIQSAPINVERTKIPEIEQNFQIAPEIQELRGENKGSLEKDYVVKVGGFKEVKTHSPFEQEEKKYDFR